MIKPKPVRSATVGLTLFILILVALGSCGFKDDPVPPQDVLPTSITDLRYQLSEKGVTLSWSYPKKTVTGDPLTDISEFFVYRAVVPVDSYCENCPIPFGKPLPLPGGAVPSIGGKTGTYQATLLRPGNLYFFKVRSKCGWWAESGDSNIVRFLWNTPALAPEGVTVTAGDKKNVLSWQPVTMHLDGTPAEEPIQYQVMRGAGGGVFRPVGKADSATTYTDVDVVNGRKYFYQIQAVGIFPQGAVGGGISEVVAATPVDKTPPQRPSSVRGIKTAKGIKVFWSPVYAKDMKGYRVYRRSPADKVPELIGEVKIPYTMFIDRKPPQDAARLYYSVSSIDTGTPANESRNSPEIEVNNR